MGEMLRYVEKMKSHVITSVNRDIQAIGPVSLSGMDAETKKQIEI